MNYDTTNCDPRGEMKCVDVPMASMTDMMREVRLMSVDALSVSRKIKGHLFGIGNPICEKEADPKCFRDELEKTRCELMATIEELEKICSMIGV
jgi:hypothetical protein